MDVLQLLKSELRGRREDLAEMAQSQQGKTVAAASARFRMHLAWEHETLWPEITSLELDAQLEKRYFDGLTQLEGLMASDEIDLAALAQTFARHADFIEDKLMTLMRQKIPTAEREDLYHVWNEAKLELAHANGVELAV